MREIRVTTFELLMTVFGTGFIIFGVFHNLGII
jgi:hypothetical protein